MAQIATNQMVEEMRTLVTRSASRWKRLIVLEALGLAIAAPLAYLWLVFLLDNWLYLGTWARLLANVVFVAGVIYLVWSLIKRWKQVRLSEDEVALAMERRTAGGVQNRLINALQITRDQPGDESGFRNAVVQENYDRLKQVHLEQAAQAKPAMMRVGAAALMILVGIGLFALRPDSFKNAASRIMLPLANIDPLYQTKLYVEPGDVEAMGDVTVRIRIEGKIPSELVVLREVKGSGASQSIPVAPNERNVTYTFKSVEQSMRYAVRGNDYTTPYYRIDVPLPSSLSLLRVNYTYPAYTALPPKKVESAGGDLEALIGTKADVTFVFDEPTAEAAMILHKVATRAVAQAPAASAPQAGAPGSGAAAPTMPTQRVTLKKLSDTEFAGQIAFEDVTGYQLATRSGKQKQEHTSARYSLRVLADKEPALELAGIKRQDEAQVESTLALKASATDDFGLAKVGLFARKLNAPAVSESEQTQQDMELDEEGRPKDGGWKAVEVWEAGNAPQFKKEHELAVTALGATEGDKIEIALRAIDTDPLKGGQWITGAPSVLLVGGEGVTLQVTYEQILRTEAELKALVAQEKAAMEQSKAWMSKLDVASGLRWDDKANLDALAAAMKEQAKAQETLRQTAGKVARDMVGAAGNLKLSVGMLADTEMVRIIRVLEAVPGRESPQDKRAALGDGRLAQERTIRSLEEILEQYVAFRQEWELANMVPFVKMLADRQAGLRDESAKLAAAPADKNAAAKQQSGQRRQNKLLELTGLTQTAFTGLAARVTPTDEFIGKAFTAAATSLAASELRNPMAEAAASAAAGQWAAAEAKQAVAAQKLAEVHVALKKAQAEAAAKALAAAEAIKSQVADQGDIKDLRQGDKEQLFDIGSKDPTLAELVHMREQQQKGGADGREVKPEMYMFEEAMKGILNPGDDGRRQQFEVLKLADRPTGEMQFPNSSDREGNRVTPVVQDKFEDLVGPLLEEADKLNDKYDTYNLNYGGTINEAGDIGKQGGDINSTAAASATGNQKQPTNDFGGASRSGREGARAHGMAVGGEKINRRGRDEVQEAQERTPDQNSSVKETKSSDPQEDTSVGMGGRRVETDEPQTFNTSNAGHFTEDMADRMGKPRERMAIVERQDGKLDPRIAEMLRDLSSDQEQLIERIKAIKKELKELYLPTEQLDEIEAQLTANLERLKEKPDGDVFRQQQQTLDKLRATVRVFSPSASGFTPSVARDQAVRGDVLDEPARQTIPGYEEAVKNYYEMLSAQ